jgi:hypothetical protein
MKKKKKRQNQVSRYVEATFRKYTSMQVCIHNYELNIFFIRK